MKEIAAQSKIPPITAPLYHYSLTIFPSLYIWCHAPGSCLDMSSVLLEWPEQRHKASQGAPCSPPMRQILVITFPWRVSQRQLCIPLVITAVGQ